MKLMRWHWRFPTFDLRIFRNSTGLFFTIILTACQFSAIEPSDHTVNDSSNLESSPDLIVPIAQPQKQNLGLVSVQPPQLEAKDNLWDRIATGLSISPDRENSRVLSELNWYVENQPYFDRIATRATPFLYWIVEEVQSRQLPLELALVPIVESAFDPSAYSSEHAVGLWQFMGATADSYGIQRDWWYDGRRDPITSTAAALDYLQFLYQRFDNDWLLALAAYNAGEGNVRRAIRRNLSDHKPIDFWALNLPRETSEHVPKILAIAAIIENPSAYGIELPKIPNQPYLEIVNLEFQIDLERAAKAAAVSRVELESLNPGYLRWATHPDGPYHIAVPVQKAVSLRTNIASIPVDQRVTWDQYSIKPGDTLSGIARGYNSHVEILQKINNLKGTRIVAGQTLLIPRSGNIDLSNIPTLSSAIDTPSVPNSYRVRRGDNLWAIARKFNLRSVEIANWNNIDTNALLHPGQILVLHTPVLTSNTAETIRVANDKIYTIVRGDSLERIAGKFNLSVDELAAWNDLSKNSTIYPGQKLALKPSITSLN